MPTPRHTTHHLRTITTILTNALTDYPTWHRWITSTLPDGYPTAGDGTGTHTSDISDPTGRTALQRHRHSRLITDAEHTVHQLLEHAMRLEALLAAGPARHDTAAAARASRCAGSVDPTCTRLADGRRHKSGLCDRCWQIRYRDERRAS
jgi:hypothetical protein